MKVSGQRYSRSSASVTVKQIRWDPEPVWMLCRREQSIVHAANWTPIPRSTSLQRNHNTNWAISAHSTTCISFIHVLDVGLSLWQRQSWSSQPVGRATNQLTVGVCQVYRDVLKGRIIVNKVNPISSALDAVGGWCHATAVLPPRKR